MAYGRTCKCCGEQEINFLAIDHINGGGSKHRKALKKPGKMWWKWLKEEGYPKEFQILCHNCNMAKGFYGQCPHENKEVKIGVSI